MTSFRFLHSADIHLDSPLKGLAGQEGSIAERIRTATREALDQLVGTAIEEQVAFLIVAGDLYDGDWRDYNTGLYFVRQMGRFHQAGIPVYLLHGNHDAESRITRRLTLPDNVHVFGSRRPESSRIEDLGVVLHGQSFGQRAVIDNLALTYPEPVAGSLATALEEMKGLEFDENLVHRAEDIKELHERRIEIRRERADLPKRQAELDAVEADLHALALELGWRDGGGEEVIARIPARAELAALRSLLGRRGALALDVENRAMALEEAEAGTAKLRRRVEALGEVTDVSGLVAVITAVRERGDLDGRMRTADQQVEDARGRIERVRSSLHPSVPSEKDAVSARIDVIDQMREKAGRISDLRHQRIGKINRDIADFEAVVANLVSEVAGELAGVAAEEALLEIERRLEEAERTRDLRESKEKETKKIENEVRVLVEERQRARESVGRLRSAAGSESDDELRRAIERSDSLRTLRGELDATLRRLRQEGDGRTPVELENECEDIDVDGLAARDESAAAELTTLRDRLAAAAEDRSQAREAFQEAGGDDAAARAEAVRQEALAEIRDVSERYVRVRSSALLMQWAIDRYRREKQAPLLRRAGRLFATITGASFESLRVAYDEKDRPYLTGLRPSGEVVRVSGMSSGTADQLYLALRIGAVEDYLDHGQAMPFVADDLFINFDDDRAGAGLRVLGELSRKTQVLFFTHHSHLLDIAREALGDSIYAVNLSG